MHKPSIAVKKKLLVVMLIFELALAGLAGRVFYLQAITGNFYQEKAYEQQTRDRLITPKRGTIYDRNRVALADTETVCSVSVIHNQIKDKEQVTKVLSEALELDYDYVLNKVSKKVALERIKTKVDKELADKIRAMNLKGVVIDEDIKRVYPYSTLASQVLGFVGKDNQGIIGIEAKYDKYLKGESGKILTETDVKGRELPGGQEFRIAPVNGYNLVLNIDVILQQYAEQTISKTVEAKNAKRGAIIIMNPQNGEIYAMANKPDFDLNKPFEINNPELAGLWDTLSEKERNDHLNRMWRNFAINDTYEPGSTFKIITSAAGLEEKVVTPTDRFVCTGSRIVGGRAIKCWRSPRSHGSETFVEGVQNSCNPVFMEIADRLGATLFYDYMYKFGFAEKTGIDLPGEAVGIMHKLDNVGPVELATMSFGQSFQITPLQLLRASAATVNGGYLVTPHIANSIIDNDGNIIETISNEKGDRVISEETSDIMREILESVVYTGTGNRTYLPGYRVGGKTATSEKLPRRSGKYIASFLAFAPSDNPQIMALVLIDEPQGAYYGGQVAGPVMKELLQNVLPYMNVKPEYTQEELELPEAAVVEIPNVAGKTLEEAVKELKQLGLVYETIGEGKIIGVQFPMPGELINKNSKMIIYLTTSEQIQGS